MAVSRPASALRRAQLSSQSLSAAAAAPGSLGQSRATWARADARCHSIVRRVGAMLTLVLPAAQKQYGWFLEAAPEDIAYLADLPFSLALPSHGVLVVHAGLVPGVPLPRQSLHDLIEARTRARATSPDARLGSARMCPAAWLAPASHPALLPRGSGRVRAHGRAGVHGGGHCMPVVHLPRCRPPRHRPPPSTAAPSARRRCGRSTGRGAAGARCPSSRGTRASRWRRRGRGRATSSSGTTRGGACRSRPPAPARPSPHALHAQRRVRM